MPRQRRSRYTAVMHDGSMKVILAYSAEYAKGYYSGRGYLVKRVVKGDLRVVPTTGSGWTLDRRALNAAAASLGITRPVYVKTNGKQGGTRGTYRMKAGFQAPAAAHASLSDFYHHIIIKSYLTPEQATETLWHELQHAAQAEKAGSLDSWAAVSRQQRSYPYRVRPIEVEARRTATANKHIMLAR